jgi:2-polyprenyl-3-methyl-5-hydroxy-6-metoxy-1,4-benzoquinol methylase
MYQKLEVCPACKHPSFHNFLICTDYAISGDSFALVKCDQCQHIFVNPRPSPEQIGKYYDSPDYISHSSKPKTLTDRLYNLARYFTARRKLALIKSYTGKKGKLFDFGCGTGYFLKVAQAKGWEIAGMEPNVGARSTAQEVTGIEILDSLPPEDQKFDVITAWHVVEHVFDVFETLRNLRKRLNKNGMMFIALPNWQSYDARHYQQFWAGYDVPRHLHHFSKHSFVQLARKQKLRLVTTEPMKLDAFYVSLLSEGYKTGNKNILTSIKNGWKSNQEAKQTGGYSSLIYILTQ